MFDAIKATISKYLDQLKLIVTILVLAIIVYFINDYRDTRKLLQQQQAITSTLSSDFKRVGEAYQTTNEIIKKNSDAQAKATELLGTQMVQYMSANNAQLQTLYSSIGKINSSIIELTRAVGGTRDQAGVVKDVHLAQERPNAPTLTTLSLNYDPAKPLGQAFTGSRWYNNKEMFRASFGEWKQKDGGYRSAAKLGREVYDQAGNLVGKEDIPLEQAEASFTPSAFGLGTDIPRFTVSPVVGYNLDTRKWVPGVLGEYRVTNNLDVKTGFIGPTVVIGAGYKFNIKP